MYKKIAAGLFALTAVFALTACGGEKETEKKSDTVTAEELVSVYDFNLDDYVTLGDYKNITVECDESKYEVSDNAMESYIDTYIESKYDNVTYEKVKKDAVEKGDYVNIDYTGTMNGKKFDGGSDKDVHLEIGSGSFIDGFEDGLIGHKAGDSVKLKLQFPDDYWNKEYAGKKVKFAVKIHAIEKKNVTAFEDYTDEEISEKFEFESKEDMYNSLKESLETTYTQQKQADVQEKILEKLLSISKVEVPDELLQKELDETMNLARLYAEEEMGMDFESYLKQNEGLDTEEEYREKVTPEVKKNLEEQLVIDAVVKTEGWDISLEGYEAFLEYYLSSYGLTEEEFYDRYGGKKKLMMIYAENTMIMNLVDNAKLVSPDAEKKDAADSNDKKKKEKQQK